MMPFGEVRGREHQRRLSDSLLTGDIEGFHRSSKHLLGKVSYFVISTNKFAPLSDGWTVGVIEFQGLPINQPALRHDLEGEGDGCFLRAAQF